MVFTELLLGLQILLVVATLISLFTLEFCFAVLFATFKLSKNWFIRWVEINILNVRSFIEKGAAYIFSCGMIALTMDQSGFWTGFWKALLVFLVSFYLFRLVERLTVIFGYSFGKAYSRHLPNNVWVGTPLF